MFAPDAAASAGGDCRKEDLCLRSTSDLAGLVRHDSLCADLTHDDKALIYDLEVLSLA